MTEFDVLITEQAETDLGNIIAFIQQQWPESVKIGSDSKGVDAFKIIMPDKKLSRKLVEHVGFGEG